MGAIGSNKMFWEKKGFPHRCFAWLMVPQWTFHGCSMDIWLVSGSSVALGEFLSGWLDSLTGRETHTQCNNA